ncbi:MAG: hypothetical protein ACR2MP_05770 [Streptosporangiaceae bacterium]
MTPAPDDAAAPEQCAAQLRRDHPRWIVIWAERKNDYQARPLLRVSPGTLATGATPEELTARMTEIEQRARPLRKDAQ